MVSASSFWKWGQQSTPPRGRDFLEIPDLRENLKFSVKFHSLNSAWERPSKSGSSWHPKARISLRNLISCSGPLDNCRSCWKKRWRWGQLGCAWRYFAQVTRIRCWLWISELSNTKTNRKVTKFIWWKHRKLLCRCLLFLSLLSIYCKVLFSSCCVGTTLVSCVLPKSQC